MIKFLKSYIKKIIKGNQPKPAVAFTTEEEYYEYLFTKNQVWSKPQPNNDEKLRWETIKLFVETGLKANNSSEGVTILDLGCGRGWLSNLLSQYGKVTGIEPVKAVVEYAQKMFPNIEFLTGTSKTLLENKTGYFDFVVSSEVLEHVPDEQKDNFIEDISNLLKNDGFLILTTPRKEAQEEWNNYVNNGQPIEEWISEGKLEALVTKNHFKKISLKRASMRVNPNSPEIEIYQLWLFQKC